MSTTPSRERRVRRTAPDGIYAGTPRWARQTSMVRQDTRALVAASFPVKPSKSCFDNPRLSKLTPLTVTNDGRVFGHVAGWRTSHIGMAGSVKPPRSRSGYAYFKTGVVECEDGSMVDVGQITLTGGHAPLEASTASAVKHYDDTKSQVMDVTVGEDKHGIWVAGALRPDVTAEQLRSIRASGISGDWRPIDGKLEMVAICSVPVPGFPIPRARVASGVPLALVAAGTEPLVELAMNHDREKQIEEGITAGLEIMSRRMQRVESVLIRQAHEARKTNEAAITAAARKSLDQVEELRQRVHKPVVAAAETAEDPRVAELRARVRKEKSS